MPEQMLRDKIKRIAKLHEDSWDAKREVYKLSLSDAAASVGGEFCRPAYLLLAVAWNDALDYAND